MHMYFKSFGLLVIRVAGCFWHPNPTLNFSHGWTAYGLDRVGFFKAHSCACLGLDSRSSRKMRRRWLSLFCLVCGSCTPHADNEKIIEICVEITDMVFQSPPLQTSCVSRGDLIDVSAVGPPANNKEPCETSEPLHTSTC